MAEDNILRSYRSSEPARRASAPAAPRDAGGSDPLAELARLIGQSDPFAEYDRNSAHATETQQRAEQPASDWRKTAAALARESMRAPPAADSRFEQVDTAIAAAKSLRVSPDDQFAHPASHASHAVFDHAAGPALGYTDGPYTDGPYDDEPQVGSHLDDRLHDPHHTGLQPSGQESENYFFDGAAAPSDERFYDDPPRARKTNGLVTVVVLIGCGILGTAGAYGYRTYHSGVRPTDAPIISAEKLPNKMVPAPAGSDPASGKSVERIGASNERVVTRQEEPVAFDPNGPRVVLPAPFTTSPGPGPSVQSSGAATEPKKVKTVPIRPESADPTARPINVVGSPPQQLTSSPPPAAARQLPPSKPVAAPARNGAAPLSLEPQGQPADTAPRATPRLASASSAAPGNSTASGGSAASGGYVVQISSQRSEAEAQASIRGLQAKFPAQLGSREASVRRADLGEKGVYYRAMVGPFGTAGDADQFCGGLKAAGGQCIVQKN
jgi:hypothetical protein